jgi:flagellin
MKNVGFNQQRASSRLASGLRVNTAADDAAGLAISERMRSQIRGLDQASRNAQDGISFVQVAEGALIEITNMAQRARELLVQAANDTNQDPDRKLIEIELVRLFNAMSNMATFTQFNGISMLAGDSDTTFWLQIGANSTQGIEITSTNVVTLVGTLSSDVVGAALSTNTGSEISELIDYVDDFLSSIAEMRARFGAWQNELEFTVKNLDNASENQSAAESRIRDADMAREMMKFTQSNVLQQAAMSMLAQANQAPMNVLQLLN